MLESPYSPCSGGSPWAKSGHRELRSSVVGLRDSGVPRTSTVFASRRKNFIAKAEVENRILRRCKAHRAGKSEEERELPWNLDKKYNIRVSSRSPRP